MIHVVFEISPQTRIEYVYKLLVKKCTWITEESNAGLKPLCKAFLLQLVGATKSSLVQTVPDEVTIIQPVKGNVFWNQMNQKS